MNLAAAALCLAAQFHKAALLHAHESKHDFRYFSVLHKQPTCRSASLWTGGFTGGTICGCIVGGAMHDTRSGAAIGAGIATGLIIFCVMTLVAYGAYVAKLPKHEADNALSFGGWLRVVGFSGSRNLRSTFKRVSLSEAEERLHIATFDVRSSWLDAIKAACKL